MNKCSIWIRGKEFEVVDVERTTTKGPLILLVRETIDQQKLQSSIFYATKAYDFVASCITEKSDSLRANQRRK